MTAKVRLDPYKLVLSINRRVMVMGFDYVLDQGGFLLGFTASYN